MTTATTRNSGATATGSRTSGHSNGPHTDAPKDVLRLVSVAARRLAGGLVRHRVMGCRGCGRTRPELDAGGV